MFEWFGDACDWVGDHVSEAWDAAGECFSDAGECFSNGNILGGIGNGFAGASTGLFGTVSCGGTVALGDAIADTDFGGSVVEALGEYKLGEDERNEKCAQGWKDVQEYWSLAGDHFKNGNIMGGIYSGTMGVLSNVGNTITLGQAGSWGQDLADRIDFDAEGEDVKFKDGVDPWFGERILARIAKGNADSEILQEQCEAMGKTGYANLMGTIDCASLALDVWTGTSFTHIATAPLKQIGKEGLKQGIKVGTKTATKEVVAEGAKEATKAAVKESVNITAKQWAKKTLVKGAIALSAAQVCSAEANQIIKDTQEKNFATAVFNEVAKQAKNVGGDAVELADDVVDATGAVIGKVSKFIDWLKEHPLIARTVNTAKGIGSAMVTTLGSTKLVSNVAAWGKKTFDFDHSYMGVSVSALAEEIRNKANKDNKTFMQAYVDSVKKNDAEVNLNAADRLFVGGMIANEGVSTGDAEPSFG